MATRQSNIITQEESNFIKFLLARHGRPREVKAGLQRLCAHYDNGQRIPDPHEHRLLVRALLWNESLIVRRWSYKAIAMFGERNDSSLLVQRLKTEQDLENQTWGIAAIIALARDKDLREACSDTGLDQSIPLMLAARLFAHQRWIYLSETPPVVNIDREDALTLKWASLLAGYGRAPKNLFHPQHENRILLAKLNCHPVPEVSEYSVWALCQHPQYGIGDLGMALHAISEHPENVRRWVNRLITKSPSFVSDNFDLFDDLRRDDAISAREGLALGIRQTYVTGLDKHVLRWHDDEPEELIRDLLLEHMAQGVVFSTEYGDLVERSYGNAGRTSGVRQRLLAASRGTPLYAALRRIDIRAEVLDAQFPLLDQTIINVEGDFVMNKTTFNAGRDIIGQNLVGGDMVGSANQALQNMTGTRESERLILSQIMELLTQAKELPDIHKTELASAVEAVAKDRNGTTTARLIEALKYVQAGSTAIVGTVAQLDRLIEVVSTWIPHHS